VTPGRWASTTRVDAHLDVLASLDHDVSRRGAYVAYVGSREVPARLRVLGTSAIAPGTGAAVRLFLADAVPLLPGDRFVLRESGRDETVGGGEVLDIAPVRPASKASPDRSIERVVRERGWVTVDELELLTGERVAATLGRWVVTPDALEAARADVRDRVAAAGPAGLDVATLDDRQRALLDELAERAEITMDGGRARAAGTADPYDDHPFVRTVRDGWFSPPDVSASAVTRNDVRELVRRGHLVERDGVVFHRDAVEAAAGVAAQLLAGRPHGYTMGEFRDALGTTRKHALPLAALLDAAGVTRRRDDVRIAGPRLPAA
jgi:selenocysteine-specific elongation factor